MEDRQTHLCTEYIDEYLRGKGLTWEVVNTLPPKIARQIMCEASTFAALKLAELDERAHMVKDIHGAARNPVG